VRNNNWPVAGVPNPISKSLRFNSADSPYLNRTPGVAGNRRLWTFSGWAKRSTITSTAGQYAIMGAGASTYDSIGFNSDSFQIFFNNGTSAELVTTQVFRDASAWYHIVIAVDTAQATSTNRIKLYINGSQVTVFSTGTYPSQNYDTQFNTAEVHRIGTNTIATNRNFDGYMTEINFIDGQALTPSSFGMTDPQTGVWEPIRYTGTYGTNGFYLNFKDSSSTTNLGLDYSGNSNNWTTNNFSVTAGSSNDSLTDVPTPWIAYNTTGDVGGVVRGNYATFNPLNRKSEVTLANGNLDISYSGANGHATTSTIGASTGKWYFEVTAGGAGNSIGLGNPSYNLTWPGNDANSYGYRGDLGQIMYNGSAATSGLSTFTSGDVIGVAIDIDAGKVWWAKNGTWLNSGNPASGTNALVTTLAANTWFFAVGQIASSPGTSSANFGQRPFAYTPPAGFLSLCTTNLPTPTIGATSTTQAGKYFGIATYAGTGSTNTITTGIDMATNGGFAWFKARNGAFDHHLINNLAGYDKFLSSNKTDAENTYSFVTSTTSTGLSINGGSTNVNGSGYNYVAWNWAANGTGVTNTAGSITSTVSANTTAGFSVVTYTGTGSAGTVGHGLGVAPSMMFIKSRSTGGSSWIVYHSSISPTNLLTLQTTAAQQNLPLYFNSTATASTVFSIGSAANTGIDLNVNGSNYVAYCFAAVAGYSAFGTWQNNNSTSGTFIYTGFRPRFILLKNYDNVENWFVWDSARQTYNMAAPSLNWLQPNSANAEGTNSASTAEIDGLSNGFKIYTTNPAAGEISFGTRNYIYAAFAESPFKYALAR
jgi:hypothetical protein